MTTHGDAKILYLFSTLTNCPKRESTDIYERCKARYEWRLANAKRRRHISAAIIHIYV
jgi:hypothetical protein